MSLLIDKRVGSGELAKYLAMIHLPVTVVPELPFGDFAFLGNGPEGSLVPIGIERKALKDFVNSFYSGRLAAHQLPGMLQGGTGFLVIYIVLEGLWRVDIQSGLISVPSGKKNQKGKFVWEDLEVAGKGFMYRELEHIMMTLENKGGVIFRRTGNKPETGRFISALYHWWTDKEWEAHRSHLKFKTLDADKALLIKPTLCRQIAAQLPGVGWVKSGAVAAKFGSVTAMVAATEKDWTEIEGIGKTMAKKIISALNGTMPIPVQGAGV